MNYYQQKQKVQKQQIKESNKNLVNAWIRLENVLQETDENNQDIQKNIYYPNIQQSQSQKQVLSGGPTQRQLNILQKQNTQSSKQLIQRPQTGIPQQQKNTMLSRPLSGAFPPAYHKRPISAISKNSSQLNIGQLSQGQDLTIIEQQQYSRLLSPNQQKQQDNQPLSKVSTMKSLMNLRAQSRPFNRPGTANVHVQQKDLNILSQIPPDQMENLIQKSEIIHSLQVDQILDLYTTKCLDTNVEYKPDQAVKFIDKIRKNCKKRIFQMSEQGFGLESANILAHIFQNNQHFSRIELDRNGLGDNGVALLGESLKYNDSVVHLNLCSNDIFTKGFVSLFESLIENTSIISLDISSKEGLYRNRISQEAAEAIEQYLRYTNQLMFLNIATTNLTRECMELILIGAKNNNSLIYLNLQNNKLGPGLTEDLYQHIQCSNIQELNLSKNQIGDQGMIPLAEMLGHKSKDYRIIKLDLSDNNITSVGISRLFLALTKNNFMQDLILDNNSFNSKSFQNVTNLLWETNTLLKLSINNCEINKDGGEYIGYGIQKNQTLKELYLSNNKIRDYGMKFITEGLKENKTMEIIDLSCCKIGDEGGMALSNVLNQENNLKKINLWENNIHDYSGILLAEAVRANRNLIFFNCDRNPISYKFSEDIQKSINTNLLNQKKQKVPKFLNIMHDLKTFERQKYDVEINKVQLDQRQQVIEQQINKDEQKYQKQQDIENKQTLKKQKELEIKNQDFKEATLDLDKTDQFIKNTIAEYDFLIKDMTKKIGNARADIIRIKSDMDRIRQSQVLKNKAEKLKYIEIHFNEAKSKQLTATQSYISTQKQITKLQESIARLESGYDSEEEREKEEIEKKKIEQQKIKEEQQKQQNAKKNIKNNNNNQKKQNVAGGNNNNKNANKTSINNNNNVKQNVTKK